MNIGTSFELNELENFMNAFWGNNVVQVDQSHPPLGNDNGDGIVSLLDIAPFVNAITTGTFIPAADVNMDGVVSLLDVAPFVDLLTG